MLWTALREDSVRGQTAHSSQNRAWMGHHLGHYRNPVYPWPAL